MDPAKVQAALFLSPLLKNYKQVQRFLGFANFYRKFIQGYSSIVAPLHHLTSSKKKFKWSPQAERSFSLLKTRFTSAPILTLLDPKKQFIIEVDASDSGVEAILSQRSDNDNKLHPCVFFSRHLTPAERNYSIGNCELLADKLVLKKWRHWLEGANQQFQVWTDHCNLEYLITAKRFNPQQARWSMFFDLFDFVLSFLPGFKNSTADVPSRMHSPEDETEEPGFILPFLPQHS